MSKRKRIGMIAMDMGPDGLGQLMTLRTGSEHPRGGIIDWCDDNEPAFVFPDRQEAKAAIERTYHYKRAFGLDGDAKAIRQLKLIPVEASDREA